jgi:HlyD family secretion protein
VIRNRGFLVKKWLLIGGGILLLVIILAIILGGKRSGAREVETAVVQRRELVATVTASGTIHPKRSVDVSANTMGRITHLAVAEGDTVQQGQFLLEIDPTEFEAAVRSLEAGVRTATADLSLAEASAAKAAQDLARAEQLHQQSLVSEEQLETARTNASVEKARVEAARSRLLQQQANLESARYDLEKVTVTAPMSGVVTRLNVEEGENAIMGTLNNPGTVLLEIADLSTMEARVKVDETEVVRVALGQPAKVEIDAFPDTTFSGLVTEIGNSPIYTSAGAGQQAVDFEVRVTLADRIPTIRPGLSAKAEIETARRADALAVPLGAVTVREWPPRERLDRHARRSRRQADPDTSTAQPEVKRKEVEGVFLIDGGTARFQRVEIGIAGEEDFEVLSGLEDGQRIVSGPFRILRELQNGDPVKAQDGSPQPGHSWD